MGFGENNVVNGSIDRIIRSFDVSGGNEEININEESGIGEMEQSEFAFTDGFEENLEESQIEEIEILKDADDADVSEKILIMKENKESPINENFKEYIKTCREMDLIPSWTDFEKYTHLKKREAQP